MTFFAYFFVVVLLLLFFDTGFLCVTALAVLELVLVDQAGLELTETHLPLPPKGMRCHHLVTGEFLK